MSSNKSSDKSSRGITPQTIAEEIYSQYNPEFQKYLFQRWRSDPYQQGLIYRGEVRSFFLPKIEDYLGECGWERIDLSPEEEVPCDVHPEKVELGGDKYFWESRVVGFEMSICPGCFQRVFDQELDQERIQKLEEINRRIENHYILSDEMEKDVR